MTEPKIPLERETVVYTPEATRIYKEEVAIVVISTIFVMIFAMGVLFMLPFPQLLEVKVWGFPFPYWYQLTINWFGPILLGIFACILLAKNDDAKANVKKEVK